MAINIFVEHFLEFTAQGYMHVYQELCVWHEHIIWNRLSTFLSWYRIYHVIRQIGSTGGFMGLQAMGTTLINGRKGISYPATLAKRILYPVTISASGYRPGGAQLSRLLVENMPY